MDPDHQERIINEVLYLHSLYNYGPPPATSSPPPPPPIGRYLATITGWTKQTPFQKTLHSTNHTRFKKPISKKPKKREKEHFSGKEWPVKPPVDQFPATLSGWPELKLKPKVKTPTKEELEISKWNKTQLKAVEKVKDFYKFNKIDEDDDDVSNDSMDEDDDDVSSDEDDDKEDGFYWEVFNGDEDLKEKYVKGCLGGVCEFTCLVCGGAGEKYGKRFKDCVGLVQHAVTVNKTKRRRGHRVFGKVVCRVLGWDIDRLPSSGVAECKNGELQGTDNTADKDFNTASSSTGVNQIMDSGNSNRKADDVSEVVDDESMVCEDSAVITNVEEENKMKQVLDEAVGNCQQSLQELVINNGAGSSTSKMIWSDPCSCRLTDSSHES